MKKLYLLLVMLCVCIGVRAYEGTFTYPEGTVTLTKDYTTGIETVECSGAGAFTAFATEHADVFNSTSTEWVFKGKMNAGDFNKFTSSETLNSKVTYCDFSGVEVVGDFDASTVGFGTNLSTLILPSTTTLAEIGKLQAKYNNNICLAYFTAPNRLSAYAFNSKVAGLKNIVTDETTLTFMPVYSPEGAFSNYVYNTAANGVDNGFLQGVGQLPVVSIDFSMIAVDMSTDFRVLNEKTKYISIPLSGKGYNWTEDTESGYTYKTGTGNDYFYPENIEVVSTYKSNVTPYASECTYDGFDFVATESTNITYIRKAGALAGARAYVSDLQRQAACQTFVGDLNAQDIAAMDVLQSTSLNFAKANCTSEVISGLSNTHVQYLALPDNTDDVLTATSEDDFSLKSHFPALICAGVYNTEAGLYKVHSTEAGHVKKVTSMIHPKSKDIRNSGNLATGLENIVFSGYFNNEDINVSAATGNNSGLESATIKNANLTNAVFVPNDDFVCNQWEALEHIDMPVDESMTKIPDNCFKNLQKLNDLCIPINYTYIGEKAFENCASLTHVTTTNESGEIVDHGANTLTLPSNLEIIKTGAFFNVKKFTDIYITNTITSADEGPVCEKDAFDATSLWGYNSDSNGTGWDRIQTKDADGNITKCIAYLHWPKSDDDEINMVYTDITRVYSIKADDNVVDENGNVLYFPTQSEYNRSYIQGSYGYTWEAWETNYQTWKNNDGYYDIINPVYGTVTQEQVDESITDPTKTFNKNYVGWHQFVLSGNYAYQPKVKSPVIVKENDWYTICSPYDLTKQELLELFGAKYDAAAKAVVNGVEITADKYPEVVTLMGVKRDKANLKVTLQFTHDLVANNQQWNFVQYQYQSDPSQSNSLYINQTDEDPVIIKAGYPYMIKPYLSDDDLAAAQNGAVKYFVGSKQKVSVPVETYAVYAYNEGGKSVGVYDTEDYQDHYCYEFVGTFEKTAVPAYAYYFGKSTKQINPETGKGQHMYFRHTGSKAKNWSANSCIIAPKVTKTKDVKDQWGNPVKGYDYSSSKDDSFVINNEVKLAGYSMTFAFDDASTGIEEIEAASSNNVDNKIYSISGQFVGDSLNGLSKGLYIVNGKKYLVK